MKYSIFLSALSQGDSEEDAVFDIPYLGAEDVIDEVLALIARLENDRQETKDLFRKEGTKVQALSDKIDGLAIQRLNELPDSVQRGELIDTYIRNL